MMANAPEWSRITPPLNTCIRSHICRPTKCVGCNSWSSINLTMFTIRAGKLQSPTSCPALPPFWWSLAGLHVWHVPSTLTHSCPICSPVHMGMTPRSICVGEGTPLFCTEFPMGVTSWCYLRQGGFTSLCCLSCMTVSWVGTLMLHVLWLPWRSRCGGHACPLMSKRMWQVAPRANGSRIILSASLTSYSLLSHPQNGSIATPWSSCLGCP